MADPSELGAFLKARRSELTASDVGLPEDFADRRPSSLSGGERQRVAVARSLAVGPNIIAYSLLSESVKQLDRAS